jgi:hypothetical protein
MTVVMLPKFTGPYGTTFATGFSTSRKGGSSHDANSFPELVASRTHRLIVDQNWRRVGKLPESFL